MNGWVASLVLLLVVLAAVVVIVKIRNPEPGDICLNSQRGVTKFYSTGKVIECDGDKWVVKNGVMI